MEAINVGILSLFPTIIAITLALLTKEVISSLIIGIFVGTFIYSAYTTTGILNILIGTLESAATLMGNGLSGSIYLIIFIALLGSLVVIITKAGGSRAYGEWASKKITSAKGASLATIILGVLIFIDDYFNCITVGTVMRPVTDKYKIAHVKLAYIIDATAAPICIIAPVSSWAASIISQIEQNGLNGMEIFVRAIPFNLYAILTLVMVVVISITKADFSSMAKHEKVALETGNLDYNRSSVSEATKDHLNDLDISSKGTVFDLIIPISVLILFSILAMLYTGGYFNGGMTVAAAFGETDAAFSLALSTLATLVITFLFFIPRKVITFNSFMTGIVEGIKSMVNPIIILTLAWTIGGVCNELLSTGVYVSDIIKGSNMPIVLIPTIIFVFAGFLSFSTGTSWGTFGILIPIVISICSTISPEYIVIGLSSTLAGSVFGDHCSPISDTTILSSTAANCDHVNHVATQLPYACVVAGASIVGYIVAAITTNLLITWIATLGSLFIIIFVLNKMSKKAKA